MDKVHNFGEQSIASGSLTIDYNKLMQFLDTMNLRKMDMLSVVKKVYEFAIVYHNLEKQDNLTRIANLNEQNLKWHTMAMRQQEELVRCRSVIQGLEKRLGVYETVETDLKLSEDNDLSVLKSPSSSESSSPN